MFSRIGGFSYDRRRWVFAAWLLLFVVGAAFGPRVFDRLDSGVGLRADVPSSVAQARLDELGDTAPDLLVLLQGRARTDPALLEQVRRLAADVRATPGVRSVSVPDGDAGDGAVSEDGRAQLLGVVLDDGLAAAQDAEVLDAVRERAEQVDVPRVLVGGPAAFDAEFAVASERQLLRGEAVVLPLVGLLLLLMFRSVVGLAIPLVVAVVSVVTTLLVLLVLSTVSTVSAYAVNVVTMVGLGLAIDYCLLLVSRYREETSGGKPPRAAVQASMATAGSTVAFSGLTVTVALGGLLVFREPLLRSIAWSAIAVTLLTGAVALTLVPALLASWGRRLGPARQPRNDSGFFFALTRRVQRRAAVVAPVLTVVLLLLGLPFLHVELGGTDARSLPRDSASRQLAETVQSDFPGGGADPVVVVADAAQGSPALDGVLGAVRELPQATDARPRPAPSGAQTVIDVLPSGSGPGAGPDLVRALRSVPTQVPLQVAGPAAGLVDFQSSVGERLPAALGLIAVSTYLLLFALTRSVVLPLKALVMNVLSLSASFGALVWIFQDGHLARWLDFTPVGSIDSTVPVLIFVFAFGLSMDYEVFLLARIKEFYDETGDSELAVARGLQAAGRIVTSAAVLMVAVFLGFTVGELLVIKEIGLGIAIAIALDATLVRCLLVPSVMTLMGRWNWWAPPLVRRRPARPVEQSSHQDVVLRTESDEGLEAGRTP